MKRPKILKGITMLLSLGLIVACGSTPKQEVAVTISGPTEVTAGESITLVATVENADDKTVTWSSGNEAVATINDKGVVTALKSVSANTDVVFRATSVADDSKYAEHSVLVKT